MDIRKVFSKEDPPIRDKHLRPAPCEKVFGQIDYARVNFKNINPPVPELPQSKLHWYYWICHAFDELCRTTGERVEFTVRTSSDGKIAVNAWCYEGERVQKYIPRIIRAIEAEDFEGISELKYHPKKFVVRADPVREERRREINDRNRKNKQ